MMATIVRENKYARVLSYARGARYEVQERVNNKWETVAGTYGDRRLALSVYNRLTAKKRK